MDGVVRVIGVMGVEHHILDVPQQNYGFPALGYGVVVRHRLDLGANPFSVLSHYL